MKLEDSTELVPRHGGVTKHDRRIAQVIRLGGRKISSRLAVKSRVAMKSMLGKKGNPEIEQRIQRAKLKRAESSIAPEDPSNRKTLEANLLLNKSVANSKVPCPSVAPAKSGVWHLSGTVAPPFDIAYTMALPFASVIPILGDPTMAATSNQEGQLSASVVTGISVGLNAGREIAIVGMHFTPPGPGKLKIWANPTCSFAWKISSTNDEDIFDVGSISLSIGGVNSRGEIDSVVEDFQNIYSQNGAGNNEEGPGQQSLSISRQVTPGSLYSCCVYLDVGAFAFWPESLASSMMSATVPSISFEFVGRLAAL